MEATILGRNRRDLDQMMANRVVGGLPQLGLETLHLCRVTLLLLLLVVEDFPHRHRHRLAQEALLRRLRHLRPGRIS
jgi:hypothetical protein